MDSEDLESLSDSWSSFSRSAASSAAPLLWFTANGNQTHSWKEKLLRATYHVQVPFYGKWKMHIHFTHNAGYYYIWFSSWRHWKPLNICDIILLDVSRQCCSLFSCLHELPCVVHWLCKLINDKGNIIWIFIICSEKLIELYKGFPGHDMFHFACCIYYIAFISSPMRCLFCYFYFDWT